MRWKYTSLRVRLTFSYLIAAVLIVTFLSITINFLTMDYFGRFIDKLERVLHSESGKVPKGMIISGIDITEEFLNNMKFSIIMVGIISIIIAVILGFYMAKSISKPLTVLTKAMNGLKGDNYKQVEQTFSGEAEVLRISFNELSKALSESQKLRKQLVSDVSHELKTPLTSLQGYIEGIDDDIISADQETVSAMQYEIVRLKKLVKDLELSTLNYSETLELGTVDLSTFFDEIKSYYRGKCKERNIELIIQHPENKVLYIMDSDRIKQVFVNLIENSLKFTEAGGKISINYFIAEHRLKIVLKDTGCGIEAADIPYIFERFYRGEKSRSRKTGGSGIGLSIVKEIINAHNGDIMVKSQVGSGSEFFITI